MNRSIATCGISKPAFARWLPLITGESRKAMSPRCPSPVVPSLRPSAPRPSAGLQPNRKQVGHLPHVDSEDLQTSMPTVRRVYSHRLRKIPFHVVPRMTVADRRTFLGVLPSAAAVAELSSAPTSCPSPTSTSSGSTSVKSMISGQPLSALACGAFTHRRDVDEPKSSAPSAPLLSLKKPCRKLIVESESSSASSPSSVLMS